MTTITLADLYSADTYARAMPHDTFDLLRRDEPVHWQPEPQGPGYWALTRYEDIVQVSSDNELFSSARGGTNLEDLGDDALAMIRTLLINMDPPKHTQYRKLVATGFTPKMVRQLEPHVRQITKQIVDSVALKGSCDFVTDVAAQLPLAVICEMIGVPKDDHHKIFDWSNRLIGFDDPEYHTSPEDGRIAATEMFMYANAMAQDRKASPRGDLVSVLMQAEVDGDRLSEADFDGFFIVLAVAGNETTRNLISGAMLALIENPEQRQRLIADPKLMPTAVEEFLRYVSPLIYFRRTLQRDVTVGGRLLHEGDKVAMYYPSGNRDEAAFEQPHAFDVGRSPNAHMAFGGGGPHFCLGASLARLEIQCMFEELLTRLPDIELAGPVDRLRSNFINGIKHMPVKFTPARA
ncbi:MAG: cytochrome P450 [Chloroflexi bacterium]|nr:cytochrome P450 [Chloroflexota bacterium]